MSYAGDYTYRKRVDAGLTAQRIAELERLDAEAAAPVRRVSGSGTNRVPGANERTYETPTVTVADSETPLGDLADLSPEAESELAAIPAEVAGVPLEKHGTRAGYDAGCRLRDECPAKATTGVSCANAVSAYQRERKAAREAAVSPQEAVEVPVEPVAAEPEIVSEAVAEPAPEPVPAAPMPRAPRGVRAEGLLTDLAAAKEQVGVLETQLLQARIDLTEVTRQRDSQHGQLSALREEHAVLNQRLHDEHAASSRRIEELEEQLAGMQEHFDIQEGRLRAKAAVETTAPLVNTTAVPAHGASLQVRQMGDAFAFDISGGGEAVRLELAFEAGQLQRAAVTTGN